MMFGAVELSTILSAAVPVGLGGLIAGFFAWRKNKADANKADAEAEKTHVDAQDEVIEEMRAHNMWQREIIENQRVTIKELKSVEIGNKAIHDELVPNSGKSLRDAVDRIEAAGKARDEHLNDICNRLEEGDKRFGRIEETLDNVETCVMHLDERLEEVENE